ncbi:MAG TPA: hypothetical protein VKB35_01355 [Ktedonobacteraceae bacterium]|nr:hypothetical protein [Ktedonobacteraceae bacterium]
MAASTTPSTAIHALEAFCPSCPEPGEVTAFLDTLGFTLSFTMGAVPTHDRKVAPLPAQFHFEQDDGLCIIYLAGRDTPMSGEHFPAHQSRFWAYAGAESATFDRITRALALKWGFTWQHAAQDDGRPAQRAHVA